MLPRLWLLVGSDRPTDRQVMSLIELSWTAKKAVCDCSTSEKFIQNQVPCSYNLKSISFLLVMYTIRARCKIIIGHCIGCIDVMRCVCFQTGFQVTRRPSYCSVDHALPKFFLPYQNKPAARLFFLCLANFKQTATSCPPPFPPSQLGSRKTAFFCKPCWPVSQELVFGQKIRTFS